MRRLRASADRPAVAAACFVAAWLTVDAARPLAAPQTTPDLTIQQQLLARAGQYVVAFEAQLSNVVMEERYAQQAEQPTGVRPGAPQTGPTLPQQEQVLGPIPRAGSGPTVFVPRVQGLATEHRELVSDFLFVKLPGRRLSIPFRDVFEVDGQPVGDREARLTSLFLQPAPDALARAREIAEESARYNIGNMARTINVPALALDVLRPSAQPRFRFTDLMPDTEAGADVYSVTYQEVTGPTLVRGFEGQELFTRGRLWIHASGLVVRSEVILDDPRDIRVQARVTTLYQEDAAFGVAVPVEMREEYTLTDGSRVTGVATYGDFRRFEVRVEEQVAP